MNCRDIEPLLHAERDGLLTTQQQTDLAQHVATCSVCQQRQNQLRTALAAFQADVAQVSVPDSSRAWRDLQNLLAQPTTKPAKKRPLAPVIWFGTSLAAAAALAVAYLGTFSRPTVSPVPVAAGVTVAQADYVEAGDKNATTMVFTDQQSGWLVVWAAEPDAATSG